MTTASELVGKSNADILSGLAPQLVLDLAGFYGMSLNDLETTMQLSSYGDRATLIAYGALMKAKNDSVVAMPLLLDLVRAAHIIKDHLADAKIGVNDVAGFLDGK